jgi:nitrogen fixation protein NifU and related proteins
VRNYSPRVVEHFSRPRNMEALPDADLTAEATSACCGDRLRLYARVDGGRVAACTFLAYGCAALIAVGSLLTEAVVGRPVDELARFDEGRVAELAGGLTPGQRHCAALGKDVLNALVATYRAGRPKGALV